MKFIALLTAAYVNGRLRHPHEGVLHLEDDEAQRLVDNEAGKDVSDDFTAAEDRKVPVEHIEAQEEAAPEAEPVGHQSETVPAVDEQPAPKGKEKAK